MTENCISLRWLIVDEVSTLSVGLLGTLESYLRNKACVRHPYAQRHGRTRKNPRPFGGLNLVFSGDLWQLPPVRDIAIFAHPLHKASGERYEAGEQRMLAMFWECNKDGFEDGIDRLFELTVPKRCTSDRWLQAVQLEHRRLRDLHQ